MQGKRRELREFKYNDLTLHPGVRSLPLLPEPEILVSVWVTLEEVGRQATSNWLGLANRMSSQGGTGNLD